MSEYLIVQLIHPGGEPDRFENIHGVSTCPWNDTSSHSRKFLAADGRYALPAGGKSWESRKGELMFWGEWEPESEMDGRTGTIPGIDGREGRPNFLVRPYWKRKRSYEGLHNTDPFVFETPFSYIICSQTGMMTQLPAGSMILFGSENRGRREFMIDTVFIVADSIPYEFSTVSAQLKPVVSETYYHVSVAPLHHPGGCRTVSDVPRNNLGDNCKPNRTARPKKRRLYRGATFDAPVNGMFSFFPCRTTDDVKGAFPRPSIVLDDLERRGDGRMVPVIDPALFNAKRYTVYTHPDDVAKYWRKVADQVIDAGLLLGVEAETPERR